MGIDVWQILISVLQFASVFLLVWAVFGRQVQAEPPVTRQIAQAMGIKRSRTVFEMPVLRQMFQLFLLLARRFPFFREQIRRDLQASGNPNGYSIEEYVALCLGCAVTLTIIAMLAVGQLGQFDLLVLLVVPVIGFGAPMWALHEAAMKRIRVIGKKLPYTLDLIGLMMEAGATFTEAVQTVIRDDPDDELNQELAIVQSEIDFGANRATALRNLAERIPLDSLRGVVGAVNQAEALGTPLATILKNQANMLRMIRSVRAEEASAKASLRILVPTMFILIAVVIVVMAPLILRKIMEGDPFLWQ